MERKQMYEFMYANKSFGNLDFPDAVEELCPCAMVVLCILNLVVAEALHRANVAMHFLVLVERNCNLRQINYQEVLYDVKVHDILFVLRDLLQDILGLRYLPRLRLEQSLQGELSSTEFIRGLFSFFDSLNGS
jgi:hypothetical protein